LQPFFVGRPCRFPRRLPVAIGGGVFRARRIPQGSDVSSQGGRTVPWCDVLPWSWGSLISTARPRREPRRQVRTPVLVVRPHVRPGRIQWRLIVIRVGLRNEPGGGDYVRPGRQQLIWQVTADERMQCRTEGGTGIAVAVRAPVIRAGQVRSDSGVEDLPLGRCGDHRTDQQAGRHMLDHRPHTHAAPSFLARTRPITYAGQSLLCRVGWVEKDAIALPSGLVSLDTPDAKQYNIRYVGPGLRHTGRNGVGFGPSSRKVLSSPPVAPCPHRMRAQAHGGRPFTRHRTPDVR
jgi:hypothetical protein